MIDKQLKDFVIPTSTYIPSIGTRLYQDQLPDTVTYPCAVMFSVSRNEYHEAEVYSERFQFTAYANTKSSAYDIIDSIKSRLKRFYGRFSTSSTYTIIGSQVDNVGYLYDSSVLKHVEILDMLITYR